MSSNNCSPINKINRINSNNIFNYNNTQKKDSIFQELNKN